MTQSLGPEGHEPRTPDPDSRREPRHHARLRVSTTSIDALHDPVTGTSYYETCDDLHLLNLSRRGLCLRYPHPPSPSTRLLVQIHVPDEKKPIELVGRTCWGRVEHVPGEVAARAVAAVGIEVLGGSARDLDRYEKTLAKLGDSLARGAQLR
ncbi:MAG: PilZ domain-containing protein [Myxococcota bacterium]